MKFLKIMIAVLAIAAIAYAANNPAGTANDPFRKTATVVGMCDSKTGYGLAVNKFGSLNEIKTSTRIANLGSSITVTSNPAIFYGVILSKIPAGGYVLVYDGSPLSSGTVIADVNSVTADDGKASLVLPFGIKANNGIYLNNSSGSAIMNVLYTD